jgi:Ca2+-transporting ATPase
MWGRSLYRNIQRFILFQLTVNVVACLIVLVGAIFDTQSPLTVTQMLWVNLIMDTFAAMALASLPPSESVMKERPRDRRRFIISRPMKSFILGVGLAMTAILLVFFFWFESTPGQNITGEPWAKNSGFSRYELSVFFTIFVMLQFWNLFNAKAFLTGKSAFSGLSSCRGFLLIVILIFLGQIGIITFGGQMFNVEQITPLHWLYIITGTSAILIVGEVARAIKVSSRRQL